MRRPRGTDAFYHRVEIGTISKVWRAYAMVHHIPSDGHNNKKASKCVRDVTIIVCSFVIVYGTVVDYCTYDDILLLYKTTTYKENKTVHVLIQLIPLHTDL